MIKGSRVYLRPIENEDLISLNKWKNDEGIFRNLGGGFSPTSISQQETWMKNLVDQTGRDRRFIICPNSTNVGIGVVAIYSIHAVHRTCEIGLYIGETESQGKGFAGEALRLLENYSKKYLNIRKIKLNVVSDNNIAVKFWKNHQYIEVGRLMKERYIDGKYRDLILMEKFL